MIPFSIASITPSETISVWMPRSRFPSSFFRTASGIPPMPSWRVAPSGMSSVMWSAIRFSTSAAGFGSSSGSSCVCSTSLVTWETWMKASPSTRGIRSFTWAMTMRAQSAAALVASVSTPKDMNPCSSGGETWTTAASSGMIRSRKRRGIWCRKTGT